MIKNPLMQAPLTTHRANQLSFDFLSFAAPPAMQPPFIVTPSPVIWEKPAPRRMILDAEEISYQLTRSKRRSIGLVIDGGALRVLAPRAASIAAIEGLIRDKSVWIHRKMLEQRALSAGLSWGEGRMIPFLGVPLALCLRENIPTPGILVTDKQIEVDLPPLADAQQIKDRTQAWLQQRAKTICGDKLNLLLNRLGIRIQGFDLTAARTYWGVCTPDRRIRLNWRLIHLPHELIDYVIAHEVAHLFEMNHSPRFWQQVAQLDPNYILHRAALKKIRIAAYE